MAKKRTTYRLITAISVLALLLVTIGVVALVRTFMGNEDPYKQPAITQTDDTPAKEDSNQQKTPSDTQPKPESSSNNTPDSQKNTIDPATLSSINVDPMNITVSYVKGIGAFEFEVLRAANGTKYVEFRSSTLIGTKCTNDMGNFISIIEKPTAEEQSTLTKTTTVNGVEYGLSLADASCTSNPTALQSYQKSFSDAFSLLKQIN